MEPLHLQCVNAVVTFTHANANGYLNTCTVNSGSAAYQTMASKCADQTQAFCLYSAEGILCVRKTCDTDTTDANRDDDSECSTYLQSCTVARLGACQARATCASYKSSLQCKFYTSNLKMFQESNQQDMFGLASTTYDTHHGCVASDATLACTVRATNSEADQGCKAKGACSSSYTIEEQCKTNESNGVSAACQDKSTQNDCYTYYNTATVKCTVVATPSTSGGNPTLGGC